MALSDASRRSMELELHPENRENCFTGKISELICDYYGNFEGFILERNQSILASLGRIANQLFDGGIGWLALVEKHMRQSERCAFEHANRRTDHYGSECPTEHDERGGELRYVLDLAAFQQKSADNSTEREHDSSGGRKVRASACGLLRRSGLFTGLRRRRGRCWFGLIRHRVGLFGVRRSPFLSRRDYFWTLRDGAPKFGHFVYDLGRVASQEGGRPSARWSSRSLYRA